MKDKTTATLYALLLGAVGAHKFYLGHPGSGVFRILLLMTGFLAWVPLLLGFIDFIGLALMDKDEFHRRYNGSHVLPPSVTVNMLAAPGGQGLSYGPSVSYGPSAYVPPQAMPSPYPGPMPVAPAASGLAARSISQLRADLEQLQELRISGLLTEEEFTQQKARLLAAGY